MRQRPEFVAMLPSFETQRLLVRPRQLGDLKACLAMDRDPAVVRYIDVPWRTPQQHREFVLDRMTRAYPAGLGYWSVVLRLVPAAFVGWVLLIPYDAVGPEIEIGWRLLRSAWGNGFATEASLPVLSHGFETLGLERVVADIHPDNAASLRVAEKLGLRFVGERKIKGKMLKTYALDREEYASSRQKMEERRRIES
jgi:RimJ/RimL family protein N-acetyltransferase